MRLSPLFGLGLLILPLIAAADAGTCDLQLAQQIRTSGMDDQGKVNMLGSMNCPTQDLVTKIADDRKAAEDKGRQHQAELDAAATAAQAAKDQASMERLQANLKADQAQYEATQKTMAAKCGSYPLPLKIGMSEHQIEAGCAGRTELAGESTAAKVYRVEGALVTIQQGKVIRWVQE